MSTLETRTVVVGAILCLVGLIMFAYGISNMNYTNAASSSLIVVLGIFTGMAGMLMLMMSLFFVHHTEN
jgi:uncharacterized membrane protein